MSDPSTEALSSDDHDPYRTGTTVTFSKTVSESDVYLFAGITGDLSPNHVDEQYMAQTRYGHRVAHGVLLLGFASTCSTRLIEHAGNFPTVSYGYDRIRFVRPVFVGDTITVTLVVASRDHERREIRSDVTIRNQNGDVVVVARNILKEVWSNESAAPAVERGAEITARA